ncbi:hypothetical protein CH333_05590 [candidate division WOR-3 bacterium JGI_Cruoil_03_44_89]|uniref:Outer membrane protein beta-barrel domain-containing protein n=1 Tax=candidate division WOR-3 bacterium JGI_Cruoil_03_44_89 TaxID=1973748 RepID=A0A235BTE5_UNCW3|nr:MAG: hypothetical protein CH333_05590 [candidate division WOR-3 bacterium JGI_Cruoil_03_44_89]
MRRKVSVLISMLMAISLCGREISGGFGGFEFGRISCDAAELNERFSEHGIKEIENMAYAWGGSGYGVVSNVIIGGSGRGGSIETESDSLSIKIDMGYGLFEVGYLFPLGRMIALFPLLGIGGRNITLYSRPDLGDVDFNELLTPGGAGRTFTAHTNSTILSLSLAGVYRLGSFISMFAKAGYIHDFGGDWKLEDGAMVKNEPDFGLKGPSFSAGIVFGWIGE